MKSSKLDSSTVESFHRMLKSAGWKWYVSEIKRRRGVMTESVVKALLTDEKVAQTRAGVIEGMRYSVEEVIEGMAKEAEDFKLDKDERKSKEGADMFDPM